MNPTSQLSSTVTSFNSSFNEQAVRILLVDDQPIVGESLRRMLSQEKDLELYYCSDPSQAMRYALEVCPTVILQDLIMPDVDGLMLVKFFRRQAQTAQIPIIVLSSKEEATAKAESFALGANDYLVKFPESVELVARLRYHSTAYLNQIRRAETQKTLEYNKELERRVVERTSELSAALEQLKKTQLQLVQNEKMSSLGQLMAGIAHEINNPVGFIYSNINHIYEYYKDLLELIKLYQNYYPEPHADIVAKSEDIDLEFIETDFPKIVISLKIGAERIRNLVLSLKTFCRSDEAELKSVDIHEGIESTLLILQHQLTNQGIKIVREYGKLPWVECYPSQLNQVFLHLLSNAIDAVSPRKDNGSHLKNPTIQICTEMVSLDGIRVKIIDNGVGIAPEVQKQIFNPFFSTKPVGNGTGLGLSISYQIIVEQHKGSLECMSVPGHGAEFALEIPILQEVKTPAVIEKTSPISG